MIWHIRQFLFRIFACDVRSLVNPKVVYRQKSSAEGSIGIVSMRSRIDWKVSGKNQQADM
jgi:hypothetical protein